MATRKERDRRPWSLAVLVVVGCFEPPDPPWLLDESVEILAMRADVIVDGATAQDLAPVPADRFRTEALPGDTIRATLIAASLGGVAEPIDIDAEWFICRDVDCVNELRDDSMFVPCTGELPTGTGCSLGSGPEVTFVMPPPSAGFSQGLPPVDIDIGVVLGTPRGPQTGECVTRLRQRPYPSLAGCSMFEHIVAGGPAWKIAEITGLELDANGLPEQVRFIPPNFSPQVERFDVTIRDDTGARDLVIDAGQRVSVDAGDHVRLGVRVDPRDRQRYVAGYGGELFSTEEELQFSYWADVAVATSTDPWTSPEIAWTVPADVDSVSFVAAITDLRGGVGWGTIAFDVDGVVP